MKQYAIFCLVIMFFICQCCRSKSDTAGTEVKSVVDTAVLDQQGNIDLNEPEKPSVYMDPFDPDFIAGKWQAEDQDEVSFEAWFYVEDGYVSGQYCAMNADATRIDCGTQDEVDMCYIKSPYLVGAKVLEVEVVSCYSHKKGMATIEPYGDGQILWKLTEPPGKFGVDHFAAAEAVLYKTHFDPFE